MLDGGDRREASQSLLRCDPPPDAARLRQRPAEVLTRFSLVTLKQVGETEMRLELCLLGCTDAVVLNASLFAERTRVALVTGEDRVPAEIGFHM